MAAFFRQVLDWHCLVPLTWARVVRETPQLGEGRKMAAALLRKLTTASSGGDLQELPCVGPIKYVKEPACRMNLVPKCLFEKQRTAMDGRSLEVEKVTSSLLDMGFSDAHINELLSVQPGANPQHLLDIISEFILLGLNPEPVYVALKKSPQLLKLSIMHVKKRSIYLRKLGLGEGKLKRVLHSYPEIFTMRQRDIDDIVRVLKEKCLFTTQQVTETLHRCPCVLRADPSELEYKFQNIRIGGQDCSLFLSPMSERLGVSAHSQHLGVSCSLTVDSGLELTLLKPVGEAAWGPGPEAEDSALHRCCCHQLHGQRLLTHSSCLALLMYPMEGTGG
ncbi:transcription termination factor 4, mitochondrial isoform X2 [Nycticebus coucang]|uniref:transcription termination factor 4, mitochondrial isoform X2 n=1 Tax=Nycticebus coucang TaxID=9470 RepID=UPI00234C50A4|nr:transcription termination factor 4, mitochondrial isoform X2 [Nycticebus coucang]